MAENDTCKQCGKEVEYFKLIKPNGKSVHYAYHIDETPIEDASKIDKHAISSTYRNRLRGALHDGPKPSAKTSAKVKVSKKHMTEDQDIETESGPTDDETESEPRKVVVKQKEVIHPAVKEEPPITYTEVHETPAESEDKPIMDVTDIKRNKFAMVATTLRTLTASGMPEKDAMEIRSEMIAKGKDFPTLVNMAAPFVRVVEYGMPLAFKAEE
jgi:hypothetical protein